MCRVIDPHTGAPIMSSADEEVMMARAAIGELVVAARKAQQTGALFLAALYACLSNKSLVDQSPVSITFKPDEVGDPSPVSVVVDGEGRCTISFGAVPVEPEGGPQ